MSAADEPIPPAGIDDATDHEVIYALRTASQHQTQLLVLADQKANILIGVVVVSLMIVLTRLTLLEGLEGWRLAALSVFVLLEGAAVLMAFLVVTPRIRKEPEIEALDAIPNPLYFYQYTQFEERAYVDWLVARLEGPLEARGLLLTNYYQTGLVLKQKYRLLRYAYVLFCVGLVIGLLSALIVLFQEAG